MSSMGFCVISCAHLAGCCPSVHPFVTCDENFNDGHYTQILNPDFSILDMPTGTIDFQVLLYYTTCSDLNLE